MKTLKFRESLSKLILQGDKNTTWRLFDEKDLSVGDIVSFVVSETKKPFVKAKLVKVKETTFGELTDDDCNGHEKFSSNEKMYKVYSQYYEHPVDENTPVKIIKFELL